LGALYGDIVTLQIDNSRKVILDLCGGTGSWSKPYKDAGYDVRVLPLPEFDVERWRESPELVELLHSNTVYGILAAPPVTMFSIVRNDLTTHTKRDLRKGMQTVTACLEIIHECLFEPYRVKHNSLVFWALENPRGYLQRFLGKCALSFDPYEFGDPYTKRTQIWGMFNAPKKQIIEPLKASEYGTFVQHVQRFKHLKLHQIPKGYQKKTRLSTQTIIRSITPERFATAFFEANR
jgi:hypothetical protein